MGNGTQNAHIRPHRHAQHIIDAGATMGRVVMQSVAFMVLLSRTLMDETLAVLGGVCKSGYGLNGSGPAAGSCRGARPVSGARR